MESQRDKDILAGLEFEVECQNSKCPSIDKTASAFLRVRACPIGSGCKRGTLHQFACPACVAKFRKAGGTCPECSSHIEPKMIQVIRTLREESQA